MKISFGCDHGGFVVKDEVIKYLKAHKHEVIDFGTFSGDSVDYPDYALPVAESVSNGEADMGVLICGTGLGMMYAANKVKGIRCAHVNDAFCSEMARRHNNANIIACGARIATSSEIIKYIDIFLNTPFDGGRHETRVNKITEIENKYFK